MLRSSQFFRDDLHVFEWTGACIVFQQQEQFHEKHFQYSSVEEIFSRQADQDAAHRLTPIFALCSPAKSILVKSN